MRWKDQVGLSADEQILRRIHPAFPQTGDFLHQDKGVNDDTIPDQVHCLRAKNTRRNQVQNMLASLEMEGMPRIGTSLEAGNNIVMGGEHIHNLSLTFVSPLKA